MVQNYTSAEKKNIMEISRPAEQIYFKEDRAPRIYTVPGSQLVKEHTFAVLSGSSPVPRNVG